MLQLIRKLLQKMLQRGWQVFKIANFSVTQIANGLLLQFLFCVCAEIGRKSISHFLVGFCDMVFFREMERAPNITAIYVLTGD